MRQVVWILIISVFSTIELKAQTVTEVRGVVSERIDGKDWPIPYAQINLSELDSTIRAGEKGEFSILVGRGDYTLSVSAEGYQSYTKRIQVNSTSQLKLNISLLPANELLQSVTITTGLREQDQKNSMTPVRVFDKSFIQSNRTPSLFESLQNMNGVRPQINCNVCNTGDIQINGLEGPYTLVMIDGLPIVSGLGTVYGLSGIPQSMIERIEVVKGPASTLYGSEAVGGLINIITKKAYNAPNWYGEAYLTSWNELNLDVAHRMKVGKLDGIVSVNHFNYNTPIDNNGDGFTDIALQKRTAVFSRWSLDRKNGKEFTFAGRYLYEDRWGGEMNWGRAYRGGDSVYGESIFTDRWELMGRYDLPVKENMFFQFSANRHAQNSVYGNMSYIAQQWIGFAQLVWEKEISMRSHFLSGAAFRYTYYDDNTAATELSSERDYKHTYLPGVFVQNEYKLTSQSMLLSGLRLDHNSVHGMIFTPRVNYKWNSRDELNTARISVGNGYRVANVFTEDHAALTGARQVVFSEELKPERSWNVNMNWESKWFPHNKNRVVLDGGVFYTFFTNRILPDYDTDPDLILYGNLNGFSVSQGASINLDILLHSGWRLRTGATLMDVSITENDETRRQVLTERFSGVWTIEYDFKDRLGGLEIDYTGNVISPMRLPLLGELDPRSEYSEWYSIQNIQFNLPVRKLEIYGGVKNLLNYTPPANSIARAFDPFDKNVQFDQDGNALQTPNNPYALTFDPSYMFAPNQGIRFFFGCKYTIE